MSCDMFSSAKAKQLLQGKTVYFFGDSNVRALYKDLTWLLEDGRLIPSARLKCKNEVSHANDVRLSNGKLHSGRNYEEIRSYSENPYIKFHFITRLYLPDFINTIKNLKNKPDILVINSCVWDLTRWGSNGVEQFKQNLKETFGFLKSYLPSTRIIWLTTLPPSFKSHGGFLTKEIEFLRNMLPWHIMFANKYASDLAVSFNIDVLDLHYNFRLLLNYHTKDGIHWDPKAMRHVSNLLLTHIALCWNCKLPGRFELDQTFLARSQMICKSTEVKPNESIKQKHEFNAFSNSAGNKRKKLANNLQTKQSFQVGFQNPHGVNNPERLPNQQHRGGLFQHPNNVWQNDFPVNNFESRFAIEQYQQNVLPDAYPNYVKNCFINAQNQIFWPSQVFSFNGSFSNQSNVQNQGRIQKRNRKNKHNKGMLKKN